MALDYGIKIQLNDQIKDSDYIVNMCTNDGNAYLSFKRKNFLKNKEKEQQEIVTRLSRILQHKQEFNESKMRSSIKKKAVEPEEI